MSTEVASGDNVDALFQDVETSVLELNEKTDYVDKENVKQMKDDMGLKFRTSSKDCFCDVVLSEKIIDVDKPFENTSSEDNESIKQFEVTDKIYENGNIVNNIHENEIIMEGQKLQSNKITNFIKKKRKKIVSALINDDINVLKKAAVSTGGLISDDIRRKVWPKLVGVDVIQTSPRPSRDEIEKHHYYNQVVLDVNRSLKRFPPSIKESQRLAMLDQLVLLIMRVLCKHPQLHYYQGYHDICVTFLLVLGEETAYYVIEKLSRTHLEVFMRQSMEPTIDMLNCMYPLIDKKCSKLSKFLLKSEVGVGYCISWLITWFGHVLNDYDTVVRLFDFFLVSDPVMPMYLTSAVVLHRKDEVLQQDCDMACVHSLLSRIPDDLPFENLLLESLELFNMYDYKKLKQEAAYLNEKRPKARHNVSVFRSLAQRIKSSVPASNITVPLVIAAAVVVTAMLYQIYKY